jgi:hypothetical protein
MQKSWNSPAVKLEPLSVMTLWGTPNLRVIDMNKFTVEVASALVMGTASIQLVNLSTVMRRKV